MKHAKLSGPAIFMHSVIYLCILTFAVCFFLYYSDRTANGAVLWAGVTAFTVFYHFWVRLVMGNVSKLFAIRYSHWWFRERFFEKRLYRLLRVKSWKGKALTYNPESFSLQAHSLEEIAATMAKSETDHWINELISLSTLLFPLLWGKFWLFFATALLAMLFDGQFIVIQRYNRPRVLRLLEKQRAAAAKASA